MSDLPSVNKKLLPLAVEIEVMNRGGSKDDPKPHKLIMLLAILDLFDQGQLKNNRIYFDDVLINNFEKYYRKYANDDDWCQPGPPFCHLRSSFFWKHKVKEGREVVYDELTTSGGGVKRIQDNIEYAYFDDHIFSLLLNGRLRRELQKFIEDLLAIDDNNE
jgi:predicted restriction endonuclease